MGGRSLGSPAARLDVGRAAMAAGRLSMAVAARPLEAEIKSEG